MAEKRKPAMVLMLRFRGKRHKIELFKAALWRDNFFQNDKSWLHQSKPWLRCRFRVRMDGKWFNNQDNKPVAFTRHEFRDVLFASLKPVFLKIERDK